MPATFSERIAELRAKVGAGHTVGHVEVDQVYAHYQHEGVEFRHPLGGQAKFLEQPLTEHYREYLARIGRDLLTEGPVEPMAANMEDLAREVFERSPLEFGDLRDSGHPTVDNDGRTVYDRPPVAHRLSEDEIRAKDRLRSAGMRLLHRGEESITAHHRKRRGRGRGIA